MQPYREDVDIELHVTTFKRIASASQWPSRVGTTSGPPSEWWSKSCLCSYDHGWSDVLCQRAKELQTHMKELYDKWMVPKEKTKDQIHLIVMESPQPWTSHMAKPINIIESWRDGRSFLCCQTPIKKLHHSQTQPIIIMDGTDLGTHIKVLPVRQVT